MESEDPGTAIVRKYNVMKIKEASAQLGELVQPATSPSDSCLPARRTGPRSGTAAGCFGQICEPALNVGLTYEARRERSTGTPDRAAPAHTVN